MVYQTGRPLNVSSKDNMDIDMFLRSAPKQT